LEERAAARRVLVRARRQVQQRLLAVDQDAPRCQHRLTRLAQMQALRNTVDEQVDHVELAEVAAGKLLLFRPQPLAERAHRRAAQQRRARTVRKQRLDVPR